MPFPSFTLTTLGELRLTGANGPVLPGRRKELVLLTYIARRAPAPVPRDELAALLWGERDEDKARQSLRHALHQLRRALDMGLEVTNEHVRVPDGMIEVDASMLERDITSGRLAEAVERWGGEFLRGAEDAGDDAYRAWLEREREALRRSTVAAFARLADDANNGGRIDEELRWGRRWTERFPLDDSAHVHLIDALRRRGDIDDARAVHAAFSARLARELDVAPSVELIRLGEELSRSTVKERQRRAGSGALRTPDLVGRGAAIAGSLVELWSRVRAESAGVVIEGGHGTGKTRLCAELARRVRAAGHPALVLEARADDSDRHSDWSTLQRLFAGLVNTPAIEDAPNKALAELSDVLPAVRARFPHLGQASGQLERIESSIRDVLRVIGSKTPVTLILDDAGRADPMSERLVRSLLAAVPRNAMLLVTLRSDDQADAMRATDLGELPGVNRFKLAPLTRDEVTTLLDSMLELTPEARSTLADRLYAETSGNPLHLTASVSTLTDTGALALNPQGVWHLAPALGAAVPPEVSRSVPRARWWMAIAAAALLIAAAVPLARRASSSSNASVADTAPRVAVMDLELVSPDTLDAYLASGLTEEINSSLSRLDDLRIKSRGAVRTAQAAGVLDPVQLGQTLQVDYVVEGSVRHVGEQLKVGIRLTKAADGFQVWSGEFDGSGSLPDLHDRIAREVALRVGSRLIRGAPGQPVRAPTADARAYEHYLRGNYYLARRTPQTVEQAIAQYRLAVARDSSFGAAKARIAYSYALLLDWGWGHGSRSRDQVLSDGLALTQSALEHDSLSADAWMARAYLLATADPVLMSGAAESFERAIDLDPRNAEAIHQYAQVHQVLGNWDASLAAFRRTLLLEPDRSLVYVAMASILWKQGRVADARRMYDSALVVDPGAAYALSARALLRIFAQDDLKGGLEDAETAVRIEEGYSIPAHSVLATALARSGSQSRAELEVDRALSEIIDPSAPSPTDARWIGGALIAVGRTADALSFLERARPRGAWLWFYCLAPDFDPIRKDPRFVRIMEEAHPPAGTKPKS